MLLLGRTLVGVCFGATCVIVPIYTSEIAQSSVRGALGSYLELFIVTGVLVVYLLGGYVRTLHCKKLLTTVHFVRDHSHVAIANIFAL